MEEVAAEQEYKSNSKIEIMQYLEFCLMCEKKMLIPESS